MIGLLLAWGVVAHAASDSVKKPSLCAATEKALWSCTTNTGKIASLCASRPLSATQGYVQYRYGTPTNTDFRFPASTEAGSQKKFRYGRYTRYMVTMLGVWFENEGYTYKLHYDYHGDETPAVKTEEILIRAPNQKETTIACKKTRGSLVELEGIVPEEKDEIP